MRVSVELWLAMWDHLLPQALLETWLQVQQTVLLRHQIIKVSYACCLAKSYVFLLFVHKKVHPNLMFSPLRIWGLCVVYLVLLASWQSFKFQVIKGDQQHLQQETHKCRSGSKVQLLRLVTILMVLPLQHKIQWARGHHLCPSALTRALSLEHLLLDLLGIAIFFIDYVNYCYFVFFSEEGNRQGYLQIRKKIKILLSRKYSTWWMLRQRTTVRQ